MCADKTTGSVSQQGVRYSTWQIIFFGLQRLLIMICPRLQRVLILIYLGYVHAHIDLSGVTACAHVDLFGLRACSYWFVRGYSACSYWFIWVTCMLILIYPGYEACSYWFIRSKVACMPGQWKWGESFPGPHTHTHTLTHTHTHYRTHITILGSIPNTFLYMNNCYVVCLWYLWILKNKLVTDLQ